jgi:type I restriction enzyme S subunit
VIPEDWEPIPLKFISDFITKGATPTTYGFSWANDGILFLRSECVSEQGLDLTQSMFITPEVHNILKRGEVRARDILMTITGNVGRVIYLSNDFGIANINQHIARIRITDINVAADYVFHFLSQFKIRKYYGSITTGQAYPQISLNQVRDTRIPLPPLPEQRAIATALSDMDALITSLDRLIAKKREIKQATMQQLLTGRTRLPGFSGNESAKLGDFFELNPHKTYLNNTDLVTFIGMEDISENGHILNQNMMPLSSIKKGLTFFEHNDVLIAKITPCFENGKGACLDTLETKSGFGSTEFHVLRAKKNAIPRYIFYQTQAVEFRQRLEAEMIGTAGQKRVPAQAIIDYPLPVLHLIEEQTAIATILSDMDTEIAALEQKRNKTHALKQGMMQELLTGKTRLP